MRYRNIEFRRYAHPHTHIHTHTEHNVQPENRKCHSTIFPTYSLSTSVHREFISAVR
jgi:hypothetical protein